MMLQFQVKRSHCRRLLRLLPVVQGVPGFLLSARTIVLFRLSPKKEDIDSARMDKLCRTCLSGLSRNRTLCTVPLPDIPLAYERHKDVAFGTGDCSSSEPSLSLPRRTFPRFFFLSCRGHLAFLPPSPCSVDQGISIVELVFS